MCSSPCPSTVKARSELVEKFFKSYRSPPAWRNGEARPDLALVERLAQAMSLDRYLYLFLVARHRRLAHHRLGPT